MIHNLEYICSTFSYYYPWWLYWISQKKLEKQTLCSQPKHNEATHKTEC